MNAIKRGFLNLSNFSGRDRPGQFWPYAGVVLGSMVMAIFGVFAMAMRGFTAKVAKIAQEHPEDVTISQGPGHYEARITGNHPELMPDFSLLFGGVAALSLIAVLLLAAAVTRRLHDSDLRGAWGLIPAGLLTLGLSIMWPLFTDAQFAESANMGNFMLMFGVNLSYNITLIVLIVFLVKSGQPHPNRYGDPPVM